MHPRQGLKRLLLGALLMTATTTGALAAEKFQVITTFTVIADMAKNVAERCAGGDCHQRHHPDGHQRRAL